MIANTEFWHDAAMPYVESRRACDSRACYKAHSHPTFSIGAVDQGTSLFTGADGGAITLRTGTVVFVPASRVHACNPVPETAWSYQMLHLSASWLQAVRQEYAELATGDGGHGAGSNLSSPYPLHALLPPECNAVFGGRFLRQRGGVD